MKFIGFIVFFLLFLLTSLSAQRQFDNSITDDLPNYGQNRSIGVSLIGNGLVGVPLRFVRDNGDQIEIVPSLTVIGLGDARDDFFPAIGVLPGYNFLAGERFEPRKAKVIKNFVSPKMGGLIGEVNVFIVAVTWHREVFYPKDYNHSRSLDVGLRFAEAIGDRPTSFDFNRVAFFLRVDWNWFRQ